jgi:hypothetical protein
VTGFAGIDTACSALGFDASPGFPQPADATIHTASNETNCIFAAPDYRCRQVTHCLDQQPSALA